MDRSDLELGNALNQFNFMYAFIRYCMGHPPETWLVPRLLRDFHAISFAGIFEVDAGSYRHGNIRVGPHVAIPPDRVAAETEAFFQYLQANWQDQDAVDLAAYALWKLNWIHPFAEGNGRTARAFSYTVLSLHLQLEIPGSPTIPEQILLNRSRYYHALQDADMAWSETGNVDVSSLRLMLSDMLLKQLEREPALLPEESEEIQSIFQRRILQAPPNTRAALFSEEPTYRLWAIGDCLIFQVAASAEIVAAEQRDHELGSPFPRLFATGSHPAVRRIKADAKGNIITDELTVFADTDAIALERDATVIIESPRVRFGEAYTAVDANWSSSGVLYAFRYGSLLSPRDVADALDLLIARHIETRGRSS